MDKTISGRIATHTSRMFIFIVNRVLDNSAFTGDLVNIGFFYYYLKSNLSK